MHVDAKNVVVTGVIAGETRTSAEAKLRDAGANLQKAVTTTTDLLVAGGKVGRSKTDAARKLGVSVVSWDDVFGALDASTLDLPGPERRSVTWVVPDTVVQVQFQRWTPDGRLWHPSLKALRADKDASGVVREAVAA